MPVDTAAARAAFGHYQKALPLFFDALTEIDKLRRLVHEACTELEDTGGPFAIERAAEIRQTLEESHDQA
jgi:hypothetical protein